MKKFKNISQLEDKIKRSLTENNWIFNNTYKKISFYRKEIENQIIKFSIEIINNSIEFTIYDGIERKILEYKLESSKEENKILKEYFKVLGIKIK